MERRLYSSISDLTAEEKNELVGIALRDEAIATFAGGTVHEINNILATMIGQAHIARGNVSENDPTALALDEVLVSGDKMVKLVKQLKSLRELRYSTEKKLPVHLQYLLKEQVKIARSQTTTNIEISEMVDLGCDAVICDIGDLSKIFSLLLTPVLNSLQHPAELSTSLTLHITMKQSADGRGIYINCTREGESERQLTEMDRSAWISQIDTLARKNGGRLTVAEYPREFCLELFFTTETGREMGRPTSSGEVPTTPVPPSRRLKILLVDDDLRYLKFQKISLERMGHEVIEFLNSIDALRYFREHSQRIDMVLTDQTMADMTGVEFSREVLSLRPSLPVFIMTGYSDFADKEKAELLGVTRLLEKPIEKDVMRSVIDMVLGHGEDSDT